MMRVRKNEMYESINESTSPHVHMLLINEPSREVVPTLSIVGHRTS